jgi:hypothetical protein
MATRSKTQRVAATLLAGSRARWATSANTTRSATSASSRRPSDRRADAQPLPKTDPASMRHPASGRDDLGLTAPAAAAACSGVSYREIDATSRASVADFRSS